MVENGRQATGDDRYDGGEDCPEGNRELTRSKTPTSVEVRSNQVLSVDDWGRDPAAVPSRSDVDQSDRLDDGMLAEHRKQAQRSAAPAYRRAPMGSLVDEVDPASEN